jgi:predicted site-specific integrase-resolvase
MENEIYSVGKFAKLVGKSVRTLQRWDYDGVLVAFRTKTGRRYYTKNQYYSALGIEPDIEKRKVICYTRVSGGDQKDDLKNQQKALEQYAIANGIAIDDWLSDIGSGLNYKRRKFNALLVDVEQNLVSSPTRTDWCGSGTNGSRNFVKGTIAKLWSLMPKACHLKKRSPKIY